MSTRIKTVAVVEDDSSMQRSIGRLLAAYGFATELYASAEEFLSRAAATPATCALVDVQLPGISGIELRRRLTEAGSKMPVIFMTAEDNQETEREALATGCLAYLHKPFPARLLVDALNQTA